MTASPRHGAWLSLNAHAPPPARQLLENVPPGLETMTLTLEKVKHRLPSDAHLAADSPSVWDALGVSHQSHLFVFYPLSQRSVTSHIFLLRVAGMGWSIAVLTSAFPHIRMRTLALEERPLQGVLYNSLWVVAICGFFKHHRRPTSLTSKKSQFLCFCFLEFASEW